MDEVKRLDADEKKLSRKLWKRIFTEDSEEFLDYYYSFKCAENIIYAVSREEQLVSMLQCNKYLLNASGSTVEADYIVGVATDERFRHQGLMSELIKKALADMYNKGRAFTFLMPAAEAIYIPFGFRFIYEQPVSVQKAAELLPVKAAELYISSHKRLKAEVRPLDKSDFKYAADVINRKLNEGYDIYTLKSEKYLEDLKRQYISDGGDICCVYYGGKPEAYFTYWFTENVAEIPEFICIGADKERLAGFAADYLYDKYRIQKIKIRGEVLDGSYYEKRIMARITNVNSMLALMCSDKKMVIRINITDKLIAGNNGEFLWKIDSEKSEAAYDLKDNGEVPDCELKLTIEELTEWLFGGCCPPGNEKLKSIKTLSKVFINEIV